MPWVAAVSAFSLLPAPMCSEISALDEKIRYQLIDSLKQFVQFS